MATSGTGKPGTAVESIGFFVLPTSKAKERKSMIRRALSAVAALGVGVTLLLSCQSKEVTSAKVYIQQGDWDKAIEQLEQAVRLYPKDAQAHYLLGEGYGNKGRYADMNREFEASLAIGPTFQEKITFTREKLWVQRFNAGVKAFNDGNVEKAIEEFDTAIVIDSHKPEAYANLGASYVRKEDYEKAKEAYTKLVEINPKDTKALSMLGQLYSTTKEYEKAKEAYEKILAIDAGNIEALANLALTYDFMGQGEKAYEKYLQALQANPNDKDLLFNLGRLYFMRKDYDNAITQFKKVVEVDSTDYDAVLNIGNAYLSKAEEQMTILRNMDQNKPLPEKEQRAIYDKAKGFYEEAIPWLEHALRLRPDNSTVWYNLGVAYVNIGQKEKGEEAFKKADEVKKTESPGD